MKKTVALEWNKKDCSKTEFKYKEDNSLEIQLNNYLNPQPIGLRQQTRFAKRKKGK